MNYKNEDWHLFIIILFVEILPLGIWACQNNVVINLSRLLFVQNHSEDFSAQVVPNNMYNIFWNILWYLLRCQHNMNFIEINSLCEIKFVWWVMINHISSGNKMWQKSFLFLFQTQNSKKVLWNLEMYTHKKTLVLYSNWFFVLERNSIFKLEIFYDRRWSLFFYREIQVV